LIHRLGEEISAVRLCAEVLYACVFFDVVNAAGRHLVYLNNMSA
jgi:hypothetical protein